MSFEELLKQIDAIAESVFPAMAIRASRYAARKAHNINQARNIAQKLKVNDMVMMQALEQKSKQDERWEGPYCVVATEGDGYLIMNELGQMRSHPVPRSCLRKIRSKDNSKGGWWEVLKIVNHRLQDDQTTEYSTLFKGYDSPYWIHESDFNSKNMIAAYWQATKQKPALLPIQHKQSKPAAPPAEPSRAGLCSKKK